MLDLVNRGAISEVAEIVKANLADWDLRISRIKGGPIKNEPVKDEFSALVDYSKTLEQLLLEGCYYNINKDVNSKNF